MTKAKSKTAADFWHSRSAYIGEVIISALAMYAIASRAIETGSLQQYFLTFLFLGTAINRIIKSIKG